MDSTANRPLPGRAGQLATLESVLDAAGAAAHAVIDGEPGIGKTALLRAAADRAAARGFQVLAAQAPPAPTPAGLRERYRQIVQLTAGRPVLVVADDLEYADSASVRWLGYLARRAAGLPLVIIVTRGPGPGLAGDLVLDELTGSFQHVRLEPLAYRDAAAAVRATLRTVPAEAFTAACHRATGGNPFLLTALLADIADAGLAPTAHTARRIGDRTGPAVARWVAERLHRTSPHAERLARAVAVLGVRADQDLVAELAGPGLAGAADTIGTLDALVETRLLDHDDRDGTLSFRHPIVRTAVLQGMSPVDGALAHARAARLRHARGDRSALIVDHLLATHPTGDPWAVPALRAAAHAALAAGAGDVAVARLRRALAETAYGPDRLEVLVDLGQAELRTDVAQAVAHLTEAFESAVDPRTAARIAEHLATATCAGEDAKAAINVLDRAIARLAPAACPRNADLAADLDILALGISARLTGLAYAHRIERLRARAAERPGAARAISGILAYRLSAAARSRRESVAKAREVLALGPPDAMRDLYAYWNAGLSLTRAGEPDLARRCADVLIARGATLNLPAFVSSGHGLRGQAALLAGRLADVVDETRAVLDAHAALGDHAGPHLAEIYLIDAYLSLGRPAEAARLLGRIGLLGDRPAPAPYWALFALESRARYRSICGDPHGALADFLEAGRQLVDFGVVNPAAGAWRSGAALILHRLGDGPDGSADAGGEAWRLATEELALARAWGAPGPLGIALRAAGLIRRDPAALEESVVVLAASPARLEYARSLHELGLMRLGSARREEARGLLREAYVTALDCGSAPLVERIGEALARAGARRPRPRRTGVAALTAQERRIAELAAAGATNREIAEALFLIQRTVETHLTSVYRKLGIEGRSTLPAALGS
jgi:DNA-binding CsgD family transcriptional regulator